MNECPTLRGVHIEPYWMVVVSPVVFGVLGVIWKMVGELALELMTRTKLGRSVLLCWQAATDAIAHAVSWVLRPLLDKFGLDWFGKNPTEAPLLEEKHDNANPEEAHSFDAEIKTMLLPSTSYVFFMALIHLAHFFYICGTLRAAYTSNVPLPEYAAEYVTNGPDSAWNADGPSLSRGWYAYEQLYVRLVNSGVITFLVNCLLTTGKATSFGTYTIVLLAPMMITHALPGLVMYILLFGPAIGGLLLLARLSGFLLKGHRSGIIHRVLRFLEDVSFYIMLVFFFMTFFQIPIHYAVLVYSYAPPISMHDYINIIRTEWQLRDTACYFKAVQTEAQSTLSFVSWL